MPAEIINMVQELSGVAVGTVIGLGFGKVQDAARRHNEKKQAEGKLSNGWSVMPGSGARVAYFLIVLIIIQLICPLLFRDGVQWWVLSGVAAGYGYMLYTQLRKRMAQDK